MKVAFAATLLFAGALEATAQSPDTAGFRGGLWRTTFEGEVMANDGGTAGTDIDIDSTLNLEQEEDLPYGTVWLGVPMVGRMIVDYWTGLYEGDETVTADVTFAGTTFTLGEDVHTEIDWRSLAFAFEYSFDTPLSRGTADLRLGLRGGVKYLRIDVLLESALRQEEETLHLPIPVLGAVAELRLGPYVSAVVEGLGMRVSSWDQGITGTVYDISASARIGYRGFFAGAGYRWFSLSLDDEREDGSEVSIDLGITGAFVEAGVRF